MRSWSAVVGLMLLAVTVATGVAVEAFGFAGVGRDSNVSYYSGEPPRPGTPAPTATKTPVTSVMFAVDADLTADGVQAARAGTIPPGGRFTIDVVLSGGTIPNYLAYQVTIDYDDVLFDVTGLPLNWNDPPVIDVSGGTPGGTVVWPSGAICDPSPTSNSLVGEDDAGTATLSMTCADAMFGETTSYTGMLLELVFTCRGIAGAGAITIHGIRDTFLLADPGGSGFAVYNDGVAHGSVTCGVGAPGATETPQPATHTATPAPSETPTSSPTYTPAPSATSTPVPSPTAGPCTSDVDGDGRVTGKDLVLVIRAMRRGYNAAADVNGDGVVDFRDVRIVVNALRRSRC